MRRQTFAAAGAALVLLTGGGVAAYAATTPTSATCTSNPTVTVGATTQSFDVHCSVPKATATSTVTTTTTATVTAPAQTVTVTATPTTTTATPSTTTTTAAPAPAPAAFPDATNTGIPAGTTLAMYTGPCTISSGTITVDAADIAAACGTFTITGTATVTVTRSSLAVVHVTGTSARGTFTDSTINGGTDTNYAAIGVWAGPASGYGFTGQRLNVSRGKDGLECDSGCDLEDSYLHDWITPPMGQHEQAVLNSGGGTNSRILIRHNRLECLTYVAGDTGGCTADLSLFGDQAVVSGVTVDGNLLVQSSTQSSYCAALGYNPGKNYPNPDHVVFTNNTIQRGTSGKCGSSSPTAFWKRAADGATGNVWSGNVYDDGTLIPEPVSG